MHYAKVETSKRLKRVLNLLSDGLPHTTRDIVRRASVCAVNSIISELRMNGYDINCWCHRKGVFKYQMKGTL